MESNIITPDHGFGFNSGMKSRIFVVDNFYEDPYKVRNLALSQNFYKDEWYKGKRTKDRFLFHGQKQKFENIICQEINDWLTEPMNGRFQSCLPEDLLVYHADAQKWAAMIFLTPDAPFESGTSFYADKKTLIRDRNDPRINETFADQNFYDKTRFELVDKVGNVFNRLVIFDGSLIHSPSLYFGHNLETSRLFHMFFFN
jgi:hypothetical protein